MPTGSSLAVGFYRGHVGRLEREDVPGGDGLQRLRGVLKLHGMPFFRAEIDGDLVDQEIDGLDASEPPAFVEADSCRG